MYCFPNSTWKRSLAIRKKVYNNNAVTSSRGNGGRTINASQRQPPSGRKYVGILANDGVGVSCGTELGEV
jgi:hypothetical protein